MKQLLMLLAIGAGACDRGADEKSAPPPPELQASPASQPAPVVPKPADKAQLDRMILAGFTPHSDHLHAPGVNECPLTKGSDAIM
jgi:hypothetical protein